MNRVVTSSVVTLALAAAIACGKSEEEKQAEAVATGAATMAEGAAAVAKGLDEMAKGAASGKVEMVPFEALGAAIPEVSGWERGPVTGRTTTMPFAISQSEATFERGDGSIEVQIIDTALNEMLFAPFSMYLATTYSERSSDGYRKGTSIKGQPAYEEVNTTDKTADVTVVVNKRFIVHARGRDVSGPEPVRAILERMDFGKLPATK
jgi:hypothetical protein